MANAIGKAVRTSGHLFHCEPTAHGERPWQAKRFALQHAFDMGVDRVCWIDADHEIVDPDAFKRFLDQPLAQNTLHCGRLQKDPITSVKKWGSRPGQAGPDKNLKIYQDCLKENGLVTSTHLGECILVYYLEPSEGLKFCSVWNSIALKLFANSTTWTDGISIGMSADALKIPVVPDLPRDTSLIGIKHLGIGHKMGYFLSTPCGPTTSR